MCQQIKSAHIVSWTSHIGKGIQNIVKSLTWVLWVFIAVRFLHFMTKWMTLSLFDKHE